MHVCSTVATCPWNGVDEPLLFSHQCMAVHEYHLNACSHLLINLVEVRAEQGSTC